VRFLFKSISEVCFFCIDSVAAFNFSVTITSLFKRFSRNSLPSVFNIFCKLNIFFRLINLTYSIYGLCNGTSCRDAYINNSEGGYTGRSAGALAPNSLPTNYGTYNYKGYSIDSSTGTSTATKDAMFYGSASNESTLIVK
jgi:hypothetical protein